METRNTITDQQNLEYLKSVKDIVRKFVSFEHDTANIQKEIVIQRNYVCPTELYDKALEASRRFFLDFVLACFEEIRLVGDDYYEDVFDFLTQAFEKLVRFAEISLVDNTDKSMDDEIYNLFKEVEKRTAKEKGLVKMVYTYLESEIGFQNSKSNFRINTYDIDSDHYWDEY